MGEMLATPIRYLKHQKILSKQPQAPLCKCGCKKQVKWDTKKGWNTYIHTHEWEDPEYKEKMSKMYKQKWKDPKFKEKMVIQMRQGHTEHSKTTYSKASKT